MASDLTKMKNWVVVSHDGSVHHYPTFQEALKGVNGHVMSKSFYETNYSKGTNY